MMIQSQSYCFSGIVTLSSFFLLSFILHTLSSPTSHYCRDDQRDALLEFSDEFMVNKSCSSIYYYTAFCSWDKSGDCCSWEGVKCDAKSGQVISLELGSNYLNNSLKPNSGLFKLQYLQSLTLSSCDLYGEIPSSMGNLSHLTYLELFNNRLVGQIPDSIGNLSRLTHLVLKINNLVGQIPVSIGNLSRLTELSLESNKLVGQVPASIENLSRLTYLDLCRNNLEGQIPVSIGNFTQLEYLDLCINNFSGNIPSSFANLKKLFHLDISFNQFTGGNFPLILSNLTRLSSLCLGSNNFQSTLDMSGFHNLEEFDASANSFFGLFPTSMFNILSLQSVNLEGNKFKGPIEFGNTSSSSTLQNLNLANNQFDGPLPEFISKLLNLERLDLSDNKFIGPIPRSISKLVKLDDLDLSNNKLQGKLPSCLRRLMTMELSHNGFSSFGRSWEAFDDSKIQVLKLDSNSFQGPFSHWICKFRFLSILDLSNNLFNGSIPPCLRNSTNSLEVLILRNNSISGILPDIFANATHLEALDVSRNQLEGKIPKSLTNCIFMRFLNVGNNKIKDNFPSWLGSLYRLNVLLLRSNRFYGPLYHHHVSIGFESLKVIDISHNDFTGTLPPFYFSQWSEMSTSTKDENENFFLSPYMEEASNSTFYTDSMEMVNKGVEMEFERIHRDYKAIDFSGNRFCGSIPKSIGLLKELHLLNLSGNAFIGNIPQSLEKLTNLEALDLSRNQLSGQIPQDLGNLSSLSYMNFSNNLLEGIVPRGTQFQRQECSSFMKNPKLYGLEDICGKTHVLNPTPQESKELPEPKEQVINWIAAAIAYAPGVFCGLVIGHIFASHKHKWFMEKFGRNKPRAVTVSAR